MKRLKRYWLPVYVGIIATLIPLGVALDWIFSSKVRARKLPYLSRLGHAYYTVAQSILVPRNAPRRPNSP